ncbi:MAG: isocitrate lyase/phosphoenolpyruvate mutase family protein [Solirubrobacteraceae bacterium]|nr:isocitrate lyase/phosphoenolpyruvate mutase family protein [Solirubrobacteraceae bacterium]
MSAADLLALHHRPGGFILPNAWDAGSARILEQAGFPAVATTSAGIAFSHGRPDAGLKPAAMLETVREIAAAVTCPVTADLEAGYGNVAATVAAAMDAGAVGANLEDAVDGELLALDRAVAHLDAARAAAPAGTFVLNARTDAYLVGLDDPLAEALARAERYVAAGADCVFVPGVTEPDEIAALARGIDAPLNIVTGLTGPALDAATLRGLGVARISVGGSLARAALGYVERAAREMLDAGTFSFTAEAIPHGDLQRRFRP